MIWSWKIYQYVTKQVQGEFGRLEVKRIFKKNWTQKINEKKNWNKKEIFKYFRKIDFLLFFPFFCFIFSIQQIMYTILISNRQKKRKKQTNMEERNVKVDKEKPILSKSLVIAMRYDSINQNMYANVKCNLKQNEKYQIN